VFSESGHIIAWRAYNVGTGEVFFVASLERLDTPPGPTNLQVLLAFNSPDMQTGVFSVPYSMRDQQPAAPPMESTAAEGIKLEKEESVAFWWPEECCIRIHQSQSNLPRHLDAGKHRMASEKERERERERERGREREREIERHLCHVK